MDTNAGVQTTRMCQGEELAEPCPLFRLPTDTSPMLLGYTQGSKNSCEPLQLTDSAKEMGELPRDPLEGCAPWYPVSGYAGGGVAWALRWVLQTHA